MNIKEQALDVAARRYFFYREAADKAFRVGDGASSTGHSATAHYYAQQYMQIAELPNTDAAVAVMRERRKGWKP